MNENSATTTASTDSHNAVVNYKSTTSSLTTAPRTSKELMLYNYRMGFFNLAANWAVLHKTKHLEKSVKRGKEQVHELTELVNEQGQNLSELSDGFTQVTEAVDQQQAQVDDTLNKFREQVARQNIRIRAQQEEMQKLVASKFQTDAVVDSSIVAISGLLIRTPFISLPVYLFTALLPKRSQWLVSVLLKFAAFFQVAASLRKVAVEKGVHNSVGTPTNYVVAAVQFLRLRTHEIMASRRMKESKDSEGSSKSAAGGAGAGKEGKEEGGKQQKENVTDQMESV